MEEVEIARVALLGMVVGFIGFFEPKGAWLGLALLCTLIWLHN